MISHILCRVKKKYFAVFVVKSVGACYNKCDGKSGNLQRRIPFLPPTCRSGGPKLMTDKPCRAVSDFLSSLCSYELEQKCDMSMSLYKDKDSDTPECTHRLHAQSRQNILKIVGLVGVVAVGITVICSVASMFRLGRCCK